MKNFKNKNERLLELTPLQIEVTQNEGTEPPFSNEYWNIFDEGIYVDIVSGLPLFSSKDKYESHCGWPSFTRPLHQQNIVMKSDHKLLMPRTEVHSSEGTHLGHVFDDGPAEYGGKRFCINSASLLFIPKNKIESIVLAGGCFWGMEELIRKQKGIFYTEVGYCGGDEKNPDYHLVKTGKTNHAEAIILKWVPTANNLENIINYFFTIHDPTTPNRQGNDVGPQYRSAIFYQNPNQKLIIEKVIKEWTEKNNWQKPIVTEVLPLKEFYPAEAYHQAYLQKNPNGYTCHYERKF